MNRNPTNSTIAESKNANGESNDGESSGAVANAPMATASDFISQCITHGDWEMAAEQVVIWGAACRAFIGANGEGPRHSQEMVDRYAMQVVRAARSHRSGDPESTPDRWEEFVAAFLGEPLLVEAIVQEIKRAEGGAGKVPIECDLKWIEAQLSALDASGERWGIGPNRDMEIRLIQRTAAIWAPESVIKALRRHGVGESLTLDEKRAVFESWAPKQGSGHHSDWGEGTTLKNALSALEGAGWIARADSLGAMSKIFENASAIPDNHNARLEMLGVAAAALLERDPFALHGELARWGAWIAQMESLAERSQSAIGARRETNWRRAIVLGRAVAEAVELGALAGLSRESPGASAQRVGSQANPDMSRSPSSRRL